MEKLYYTVKEVSVLLGGTEEKTGKAYEIIRKFNKEIEHKYKNCPEEEKPIIISGRVNKEYFDKRMKLEV